MENVFDSYSGLIQRLLDHEMSSKEFQATYMRKFLDEVRPMDEALFLLLDELFGDVESCTDNPELLAKDPDFYLDVDQLERKARSVLQRMRDWHGRQIIA